MNNEELIKAVTVLDERTKSLSHRVEDLEDSTKVLNTLATAIQVLVTKQDNVAEKIDSLDNKITCLEKQTSSNDVNKASAENWNTLVKSALTALVGGLIAIAVKTIWGG